MQKVSQDAPQTEVAASQSFIFFIPLSILSRLYWLFNHNGPIVHLNLHLVPLNLTTVWGDSSVGRAFATPAGRPMLGFPRTHVKNMAGHPYTVTSALDWTETGGSLELAGQPAI